MQTLEIVSANLWEILISLANLLILFVLFKKFLYKPVQKVLDERQAQVNKIYDDAQQDKDAAAGMKQEYEERLDAAREEADTLVRNAVQIIGDPKGTAFFLLVHEQVQWADASMAEVRADLLRNQRFGPWAAFRKAVENDVREGRARAGTDPVQVASVCIAMWDGLVHTRIAHFLQCDLEDTLRKSYDAVWKSIRTVDSRPPAATVVG